MNVLMFGWEFPPFKSGGLGTACHDLTKGLSRQGVSVTFVMPKAPKDAHSDVAKIVGTNNYSVKVRVKKVDSYLEAYDSFDSYNQKIKKFKVMATKADEIYGDDLYSEVERYSKIARLIAKVEDHDVIHAHDWMAYPAGMNARKVSGKPLVCHIHATEFDRTGGNPNHKISHREFIGLSAADMVIANSEFTRQNVLRHYQINPDKIKVVHWGIDQDNPNYSMNYNSKISDTDKIVLFLGRVTIQKGPDYFVEAARKVLDYVPNTKFVVAGNGDMLPMMIERSAELGISNKMMFTGFLEGEDVHKAFQMADLYVMPSVSEPFGLVALESMKNGTPVLISKQSGVSEVVTNALKADFWDVDDMTNKIVGSLKYGAMYKELKNETVSEACKFNIDDPARKTMGIYNQALGLGGGC